MKISKFGSLLVLIDLFSLLCLFFMTIAVLKENNPKAESESVVDIRGKYMSTVTWNLNANCDVDTYLEDPVGNIIYYSQKSAGFMHLDRDDLGSSNDTVRLPDGTKVTYPDNRELIFIRETIKGEYILNVHMFNIRSVKPPVSVRVQIHKLGTGGGKVFDETIQLERNGQEETVTRFTIDENGNIGNFNKLSKRFVGRR